MISPSDAPGRYQQCVLCQTECSNRLLVTETAASGFLVLDVILKHFWFTESYCEGRYVCISCWRASESFHMFYLKTEQSHRLKLEIIKQEELQPTLDSSSPPVVDSIYWDDDGDGKYHSEDESDYESALPLSERIRAKAAQRTDGNEHKRMDWLPGVGLTLCRFSHGVLEAQCHSCLRSADGANSTGAEVPYMRFAKLMRHFLTEHGTVGYAVCCDRKYINSRSLKTHMRLHGKQTLYHCNSCRIQYRKQKSLDDHNKLVHMPDAEKQFKCDKCNKGFADEAMLASHQDWHQNVEERNITCGECNIFFPSIASLLKHRSMHHPTIEGSDISPKTELARSKDPEDTLLITTHYRARSTAVEIAEQNAVIGRYCTLICQHCEYIAADFVDLKQHGAEQHQLRTVQVLCCDQPYTNRWRLYEHCLQHDDPDRFRCTVCGKRYVSSRNLLNHQRRIHTPVADRPFCCDVCGETFVKDYLLKKHMSHHLAKHQKLNYCGECKRSFTTSAALKHHQQSYHGAVARSICEICAKGFNSQALLERHVLTHSDEGKTQLKHQCESCGRWLRNRKSYHQHRARCHSNAGPVKCKFCGRESVNSVALKAHVYLHHSNRPEQECSYCDKRFKTVRRLREHEATHTGTVLYRCPWCPRTFASGANMYKHKKAGHPEQWAAGVRKRFEER